MAKKSTDLAHTKWLCKYHIVFTPKYRRKIIYNQYKEDLRDILKQLCSYKGVEILEGHLMPDHIHMLVSIPPKYSVSSFMGYLKGKSALMMFDRHANLKYKFGNRHFWSEGYYVSTVGLNEATIRKYIQDQEKYDIMVDKSNNTPIHVESTNAVTLKQKQIVDGNKVKSEELFNDLDPRLNPSYNFSNFIIILLL